MRKILLAVCFLLAGMAFAKAQYPGGGRPGGATGGRTNMNIGHFYGKAIDTKTGKGLAGATVVLSGNKFDTATKQMKTGTIKTVISANNGDFSLDNLPVMGNFKLKISAIGYKAYEKQISFDLKMPQGGASSGASTDGGMGNMAQALNGIDKDLGNIKLEVEATDLGTVTVTASSKQQFELGIDRKIFNVDKNLTSTGQTATEIMKSIPSVNVDIDGNVTLRNATPTIFIDNRPTTLTLDQIPADIIDKIEIITNPSAKYDASGGTAGILNIILKKNKKNGYNGGIRTGVDSRGKVNLGGDINYRQGKINFNASGNYNQRKSISNSLSNTTSFITPTTLIAANTDGVNDGYFGFFRGGIDYFVDNRNTISVASNYVKGNFNNNSTQVIDSTKTNPYSHSERTTNSGMTFESFGGQLSYKHNFAKNGHDITADANYNSSNNSSLNNINTLYYYPNTNAFKNPPSNQLSNGSGYNHFFTFQSDYENPITDDSKFEAGARVAIRDFKTDNIQYINNVISPTISNRYKFTDNVYAAYSTYSFKVKKTSFQLGLRVESSNYKGQLYTLPGADSTSFKVNYPVSFFPSAFITHKLDDKQDLQLNYSRRINRPNFFQLVPTIDFSNPQYPVQGNPNLKPEFTNSLEVSYSNNYKKGANFLATAYLKYSTDLITTYQYPHASDSLLYTTYLNANNSYSYGLELTNKMPITKWWDLMLNVNLYDSKINATIPGQTISNSLLSWFAKVNSTFKLAKGLSLQISGDSRSKTLIPQGGGGGGMGGGGRGGGMFGGGPQTSSQGYTLPRYFDVDVAIRKDWTWKNGRSGSLNLSMGDIFRTKTKTYTESIYFTQNSERLRDPQVLRLNFTYRFGKFDVNLFKRKNTKADQSGGMDMGGVNN